MKMKLSPLLVGLSLAILGPQAAFGNNLLEIDEVNGTIVGTYNGNPIKLILTGPQDGWTIQLPSNLTLDAVTLVAALGEPESSSLKNEIALTQPTFLTWRSDVPAGNLSGLLRTSITFGLAGTDNKGDRFDLKLVDKDDGGQKGVPDTSSTAGILILAGFGMVAMSRVCGLKVQTNLPHRPS
jgi:hypothetical protein